MTFLLCVSILLWISLVQLWQLLTQPSGQSRTTLGPMILLPSLVVGAPILVEFMQAAAFANEQPISLGPNYWPLWCLGGGGILAVALFGVQLYRQIRSGNSTFAAVGATATGALVGLYLVFVVVDQALFFHAPNDDAGVVGWNFVRDMGTVTDIECAGDLLVVRDMASSTAIYRCPNGPQMILGRMSATPVIPWPGYAEGSSAQLAAALQALRANAYQTGE